MTENTPEVENLENRLKSASEKIYQELIENKIHPLNNPNTYALIASFSPSQKDQLIHRYIWRGKDYENFKAELGEDFAICLFHPGIDVRQEEFVTFAKSLKRENPSTSPFEAIQSFGESLGDLQVYRGMALTS